MRLLILFLVIIFSSLFFLRNKKIENIPPSIINKEQTGIIKKEDKPDFIAIQKNAKYEGVITQIEKPKITGDTEIDSYVFKNAEERGYELRLIANEERLISFENKLIQPEVKDSLLLMQTEAKEKGMNIIFVSGYRSVDRQREIFLAKLGKYNKEDFFNGIYDELLNDILKQSSVPGYSKHHSGYAIDIGCDSHELTNDFMATPCYSWLSENDFTKAMEFGFVPSYPVGIENQGPDPESWEFVYIPNIIK